MSWRGNVITEVGQLKDDLITKINALFGKVQTKGVKLEADQPNAKIKLLDINNNVISTLDVGFLNNAGTTISFNTTTEEIELKDESGNVLSSFPASALMTGVPMSINLNGASLQLLDSANAVVSSVTLTIANIQGLQAALDAKADDSVTIKGTGDLTGGGDLTANRTIDLDAAAKTKLSHGETAYGWGNWNNAGLALDNNVIHNTGNPNKVALKDDSSKPLSDFVANKGEVPNNTDLNNFNENGVYTIYNSFYPTILNTPSGSPQAEYNLLVFKNANNRVQVLTNKSNNDTWRRIENNSWNKIAYEGWVTSQNYLTQVNWGDITGSITNQTDLRNALNSKFDDPTGTTSQYIDGTGALQAFPTLPSQYTDEKAQDAVGSILSSEFTYDDNTPAISLNSTLQSVSDRGATTTVALTMRSIKLTDTPLLDGVTTDKVLTTDANGNLVMVAGAEPYVTIPDWSGDFLAGLDF